MSFKLSNLAKVEKSIDVRENDKDVREIDTHLAEVLRLIDPFDFAPAVHFAQRIDITNSCTTLEPLRRRETRGICSRCQHGCGAFPIFIVARGLGISVPQGGLRAFDTRILERWMSLLGRRRPLSKPKLPAERKQ